MAGSQADTASANKLTVMRLSDLHRMTAVKDDEEDSEAPLDLEAADEDEENEPVCFLKIWNASLLFIFSFNPLRNRHFWHTT